VTEQDLAHGHVCVDADEAPDGGGHQQQRQHRHRVAVGGRQPVLRVFVAQRTSGDLERTHGVLDEIKVISL
jgi:hypothetical protein